MPATLAWVIWRDQDAVEAFAGRDPLSVHALDAAIRYDAATGMPPAFPSIDAAFDEVSGKAAAGEIVFHAVGFDHVSAAPIPNHEWYYLRLGLHDADTLIRDEDLSDAYRRVSCDAARVRDLWAVPIDLVASGAPNSAKALVLPRHVSPARIRKWFVEVYLPKTPGQPSKEKILREAMAALPGVTRSQVREVTRQNWPDFWSTKKGPKGPRISAK